MAPKGPAVIIIINESPEIWQYYSPQLAARLNTLPEMKYAMRSKVGAILTH